MTASMSPHLQKQHRLQFIGRQSQERKKVWPWPKPSSIYLQLNIHHSQYSVCHHWLTKASPMTSLVISEQVPFFEIVFTT